MKGDNESRTSFWSTVQSRLGAQRGLLFGDEPLRREQLASVLGKGAAGHWKNSADSAILSTGLRVSKGKVASLILSI